MFEVPSMFRPPSMFGPPSMFTGVAQAASGVESTWCLSFDGVNDWVNLGSGSFKLPVVTVSAWVMRTASLENYDGIVILEMDSSSGNAYGLFGYSGNKIAFDAYGSAGWARSPEYVLPANEWHHVVGIHGSDNKNYLYVDGVLIGSTQGSAIVFSAGVCEAAIGRYGSAWKNYFPGRIDDVRIYSRALSSTEVTALYTNTSPPTDVTAYLPLEEGTGTSAAVKDSTGATIATATLTNGPVWHPQTPPKLVSGRNVSTRSLSFDGSNDCVTGSFSSAMTSHSLSCWVKTTSTTDYAGFVSLYQPSGVKLSQIGLRASGKFWMQVYSGGTQKNFISGAAINDGNWRHVCGVFDRDTDTIRMYIDGALATSTAPQDQSLASFSFTPGSVKIGTEWSATIFLSGLIDDPRIFSRALSAAEVQKLCRGQNPTTNDPVGWWKLDETSGTTAVDSGSGGNNGTHVNGPTISTDVPAWLSA